MTEIKTLKINIQDIKPAPYNPRVMSKQEQQKLKQGLQTFGLVDPIIIDLTDENTVIGGHQRLEVLREIDDNQTLTLIPLGDIGLVIRETELTIKDKTQQKALNLALNKINGDWDYSKLDEVLEELVDTHLDMDLTGFEDYEITEYLLDSYDTDILEEEEPDKDEDLINFEDSADEDIHSTTIKFHNQKQRETFIQLLDKLQEKDTQNHTPAQLLTEYMNNHYITSNEKIPPYTLLFQNQEEKEKYETILERIEESTNYHRTPLQGFVDENAI